jgi:hypothetical protein
MVVIRVVSAPEAAVEADAVKTVETAMAHKVAATKTANGEPVTTEAMETTEATKAVATEAMEATEAMATASKPMAAASAATTSAAGIGDLGQRDDHGDQQSKHQIEQLTTHDTLLCRRFSPVAIDVLG